MEDFVGRQIYNLSEPVIDGYFDKVGGIIIDEHAVFSLSSGNRGRLRASSEWTEWTCCRQVVKIQSRERILPERKIDMQYKPCDGNYCLRESIYQVCTFTNAEIQ